MSLLGFFFTFNTQKKDKIIIFAFDCVQVKQVGEPRGIALDKFVCITIYRCSQCVCLVRFVLFCLVCFFCFFKAYVLANCILLKLVTSM